MKVEKFTELLNSEFYAGVPDSLLKPLCDYLYQTQKIGKHHIIAANEGNAAALGAGYYLATNKVPVVYLQNSGIGNIINPVASLLNDQVYGIPCIFVIGWRGEPGVSDEPQHIYQGAVTDALLSDMSIESFVVDKETTEAEMEQQMMYFRPMLKAGKQVAFLIRKGALQYNEKVTYQNSHCMTREVVLEHIVDYSAGDIIISTTGKASRELFEIRETKKHCHDYDFLTVGSMGHSSSIALEIALEKPEQTVWCVDGDGAALMHLGAMALIGSNSPSNLIHVLINNNSHETVGGLPTVADHIDFIKIAQGCGYKNTVQVADFASLDSALLKAKGEKGLTFIEIKCKIGARADLGRPTTSPKKSKENFMKILNG